VRPREGLAGVSDPGETAFTSGDLFFSGQVRSLDWLTTGTCEIDLGGTASDADPLDREELWSYAQALSEAFDHVERREHEVRLDASLEACHTGPLDLSFRGGPTDEASGELLRLPLQRLCWTICHQRVLGFEVQRGPGLGTGLLARKLELTAEPVAADRRPADREGPPEATRSGGRAGGQAQHRGPHRGSTRLSAPRHRRPLTTTLFSGTCNSLMMAEEPPKPQRSDEEVKTAVANGETIESVEEMSPGYLESLKRLMLVQADTELMSVLCYQPVANTAPTLDTRISASAIVQDEAGHANIMYRLLEDLGEDKHELVYEREPREYKNMHFFDYRLHNWAELAVANALFDRAGA